MMEGLDPLGHTVTAVPEQGDAAPAIVPPPASIGRFRIDRQLGAGAMGVVYEAFDPDLQRSVAVKVLRATPGDSARNRLLREARAMARLSHPNVVTVHEVGTSGNRDYVATELISGSNLSEWLRATPRSKREIVDAFLAAGRGLAAAHEAGLVHRDFKPHNVLRSDRGRIVVTDFGLARASHEEDEGDLVSAVSAVDPGSLDAGLTRTGALIGTPGYMAPEQWAGLDVGAAADQFSFCVALWEALAGQRPFLGNTLDELRVQIQHPPEVSDVAEKIPRALRHILMRGLSQRPAERYPTMRALIEAIETARRRPRRIAAAGLAVAMAIIIGSAAIYATRLGSAAEDGCPPPIMTAETVWSPAKRAIMPERVAKQFDRKIAKWRSARDTACRSDSAELRRVRAACLDAVISTIDLAVKAMSSVDESTRRASDVTQLAAWSDACMQPTVPTLRVFNPERMLPAASLLLRSPNREEVKDSELDTVIASAQDGCERAAALYVKAVVHMSKASFGREAAAAEDAVEACGDDYLRARVAVLLALRTESPFYGPEQLALLRKATTTVGRIADTGMLAHLELIRGRAAFTNSAFDTALENLARARRLAEQGDDSRAVYEAQWLAMVARANRGRPSDLVDLVSSSRALYDEMITAYGGASSNLWQYRQILAEIEWSAGNLDRSRQLLEEARKDPSRTNNAPTRLLRGKFVDDRGRPVGGARVLAISSEKTAQVDDVDLALWQRNTLEDVAHGVTRDDGTFELDVAAGDVYVLARSSGLAAPVTLVAGSADDVQLRGAATGGVHGTIDYADSSQFTTFATVSSGPKGFHFVAPVKDGRYEVPNLPAGWYEVRALTGKVSEITMSSWRIRIDSGRRKEGVNFGPSQGDSKVHVVVRNERAGALDIAQIYVIRGRVQVDTLKELRPVLDSSRNTNVALARPTIGERAPVAVRPQLHPGDLLVSVDHLESGPHSICAVGLSGDLVAEDFLEKLRHSADKLDVRCREVRLEKGGEQVVLIDVPPMMRVD
jgi:Protein kinase domain